MLRFLIFIYFSFSTGFITANAYAEQSDLEWAKGVAERGSAMVMENFKNGMEDKDFDQDLKNEVLKPRPILQIFVSSSIHKQLLKAYAKEASRYNGVLVFRGLPDGSFRKVTDLVVGISNAQYPAAMQIDDEAFRAFDIKTVPAIVLSKPASMFSEQSMPGKFDKVAGNITIKAALEIFAREGDLSIQAKELLSK